MFAGFTAEDYLALIPYILGGMCLLGLALGLVLALRRSLGNVIDLFGIEVLADGAVIPPVCLARFQNDNGQPLFLLQNLNALGSPFLVATHTLRLGALCADQKGVAGRVEGKPALHVQIRLHVAVSFCERSKNLIQRSIGFLALLLLTDLPPLALGALLLSLRFLERGLLLRLLCMAVPLAIGIAPAST